MALTGLVAANNLSDVVDIERTWDNIGNNISATVFVPAATLDLNFASNKSLVDNISGSGLVTFTRASSGTFIGGNGLLQYAASGVPRFDNDFATGESLGLLVEGAGTNQMLHSEDPLRCWRFLVYTSASNLTVGPITISGGAVCYGYVTAVEPLNASNCYIFLGSITAGPSNPATFTQGGATYNGNGNRELAGYQIYNYAGDQSDFPTISTVLAPNGINFAYRKASGTMQPFSLNSWDRNTNSVLSVYVKADSATTIDISNYYDGTSYSTFNFATGTFTTLSSYNTAHYVQKLSNGWYRIGVRSAGVRLYYSNITSTGSYYFWGFQYEWTDLMSSYVKTPGMAAVTRSADVASISGSNFSRWYNESQGTFFISARQSSYSYGQALVGLGTGTGALGLDYSGTTTTKAGSWWNGSTVIATSNYADWGNGAKLTGSYTSSNRYLCLNGGAIASNASTLINGGLMNIGRSYNTNGLNSNGTIARLTYYSVQLSNTTLQALTTYGPVSNFPYSFSIKGRDILALKEVNKTSTRDFVFIKGLASKVQPRINTASQYTASGVALRNAAMLKVAPTTIGNYFFSSGLTLSGTTVQINGTNARSIATSPFSGSTALYPLLFGGLRPQANWRITEPMTSGTVTSPESAIPIETSDFLLFIKAGQS